MTTHNRVATLMRVISDLDHPRGALAADLGCGDGQRGARTLAECGYFVYACEMDPAKAELAAAFAKVDVCDVRLWSPPEPLDLILCAELLEHLFPEDQLGLLEDMRRWLRPGGFVILSTPQRHSPVAVVERIYTRLRRRGRYDWWDPTHVSVLTRRQLERLFIDSGFSVVRRFGIHLIPEAVPCPPLHGTVHQGRLGLLGFDLLYVLASSGSA